MIEVSGGIRYVAGVIFLVLSACSFSRVKPCTSGGQPAREGESPSIGVKSCHQVIDSVTGKALNEGKYYEWYENDALALEGEYRGGKKTGRWIEYDENGQRISDRYFLEGKEVSRP